MKSEELRAALEGRSVDALVAAELLWPLCLRALDTLGSAGATLIELHSRLWMPASVSERRRMADELEWLVPDDDAQARHASLALASNAMAAMVYALASVAGDDNERFAVLQPEEVGNYLDQARAGFTYAVDTSDPHSYTSRIAAAVGARLAAVDTAPTLSAFIADSHMVMESLLPADLDNP